MVAGKTGTFKDDQVVCNLVSHHILICYDTLRISVV